MASTGPLNLNWLSNALKPKPRASEEAASSPGEAPQGALPQDTSAVASSRDRYASWASDASFDPVAAREPAAEAPVAAEPEAAPSNALEVEWMTGGQTSSSPAPAQNAASGGLDVEWRSGSSPSGLGGSQASAGPSTSGGLGIEWRSGSAASGGIQAGGQGPATSSGLGVDWQGGSRGSGLGAWGGSTGRPGGLDVTWAGGSSTGLDDGMRGGSTGGLDGSITGDATGGVTGGMTGGVTGGSNDHATPVPPETSPSEAPVSGGSAIDAGKLAEIRSQLSGPLSAIPERPLSDDWRQNDLRNRATLIMALRGDAGLQAAFENWDQLPDADRLQAGKRIAALEGAVYGFEPATLQLDTALRKPSYGYYHPVEDKVHVSPDTLADLKEFVDTVTHEQAHAYQWEKASDAKSGRMSPSDPLYPTAMSWHANYFNYTQPSQGYQAYRTQPIEAHAFATGEAVTAGLFS